MEYKDKGFLKTSKKINLALFVLLVAGFITTGGIVYNGANVLSQIKKTSRIRQLNNQIVLTNIKKTVKEVPQKDNFSLEKITNKFKQSEKSSQVAVKSAQNIPKKSLAPSINNCKRVAKVLPSYINLSNKSAGLTHVVDPVTYFRVYGRDTKTIQRQVWKCGPNITSTTHATSQSRMNFSYGVKTNDNGTCSLSNVKVGLSTKVILPTWTSDKWTPQSTKNSMNRFLNGLSVHESGHGQIDLKYAKKILSMLQNFSTNDCKNASNIAYQKAKSIQINELAPAQKAYEIRTRYGANQGGWL